MKRFFAALLAILYLTLSSGASVHAHYCMGKMAGAKLSHAAAEGDEGHTCALCGMKKASGNGGCCHDEETTFKASDTEQGSISGPVIFSQPALVLPLVAGSIQDKRALRQSSPASGLWANGPPIRPLSCPIYIRVCSFRI